MKMKGYNKNWCEFYLERRTIGTVESTQDCVMAHRIDNIKCRRAERPLRSLEKFSCDKWVYKRNEQNNIPGPNPILSLISTVHVESDAQTKSIPVEKGLERQQDFQSTSHRFTNKYNSTHPHQQPYETPWKMTHTSILINGNIPGTQRKISRS